LSSATEAGKIARVLCHGGSLLAFAKLRNGEYLGKGKTVTGFANVEEDFVDHTVWSMNPLSRHKRVTP
jgi:putative intracellular protease/amidase